MTESQINYMKSLQENRLGFVIFGQNVLAKSLVVNELLARSLLPYQIENISEEKWRLIRIKVNKIDSYVITFLT